MNILGISAYYHDSAACLVQDGVIVAAAQEERFTRKKHDWEFPSRAARFCMERGGIHSSQLDFVAFYDKPFLKFERILETHLAYAPKGLPVFLKAMPLWIKQKIWVKELIRDELQYKGPILFPEHHLSHAASAFYPSPFDEAAVLTVDGVGEWATTSFGTGSGHELRLDSEIRFPHSLGLLYSAFTAYCGFKVNSGEYKLMGLAPYGTGIYRKRIEEELIDLRGDGSFRLNMKYFDYPVGLRTTSKAFHELFGGPPRNPESPIAQREMDLAKSIQEVLEEILIRMARHVRKKTDMPHLCLAGGVALNCVANGKMVREKIFDRIWVQPAAGDAGGALGAALYVWHGYLGNRRSVNGGGDSQGGSMLGPEFSDTEIGSFLRQAGIPHERLDEKELLERTAAAIAGEKIVGWFQGRMEFGPRALGGRSILGDARSPQLQSLMNLKIKHRESFRPFAPAVAAESAADFFDLDQPSPYMLIVAPVKESRRRAMTSDEEKLFGIEKLKVTRSEIPAVTHVDYSARVQTVESGVHPRFYQLLKTLGRTTGVPLVINTSFNVRGEPIVNTPEEAYRCFMRTEMDVLVLGSYLLEKNRQPELKERRDWKKEFELD